MARLQTNLIAVASDGAARPIASEMAVGPCPGSMTADMGRTGRGCGPHTPRDPGRPVALCGTIVTTAPAATGDLS